MIGGENGIAPVPTCGDICGRGNGVCASLVGSVICIAVRATTAISLKCRVGRAFGRVVFTRAKTKEILID
jgi:hypothetical protein